MNTPTNYHDFRKRFLDAVQSRGLQLHSIQLRGLSPQGRPVFTDIVHNVLNPDLPTIVHISGCHGVEGYIGSSIQSAILEDEHFPKEAFSKLNIIFVHSLNPYGMSWYRRVNAHNIDLNRNYFKEGEARPLVADFDQFVKFFEKRPAEKKWKIWLLILKTVLKLGWQKSVNTIAAGQYHHPESLFFGGTANESEIIEPLRFLKKSLGTPKSLFVVDVHSGLGKFASENWILDEHQNAEQKQFWNKALSEELISPDDDSMFYKSTGNLSEAFHDFFPKSKIYYAYEEFGTRSRLAVFKTLLKEHKQFLKLKLDRQRAFSMISTFFPYEKGWRDTCTSAGKASFKKIVNSVSSV